MDKIDKLIEMYEQKVALLKELKQSMIQEECDYHVVPQPDRSNYFMLIEISTKKEVYAGTPARVRSWIERRSIANDKVYEYRLIEFKEPKTKEDDA